MEYLYNTHVNVRQSIEIDESKGIMNLCLGNDDGTFCAFTY